MRKERKGRACGRKNFRWVVDRDVGDSSIEGADVCICRRFRESADDEGSFEGRVRTIRLDMIVSDSLRSHHSFLNFFVEEGFVTLRRMILRISRGKLKPLKDNARLQRLHKVFRRL